MFLDGCPLPAIQHEFLHKQVSIVSQEPVLFAESILYNIAFGVRLPSGELAVVVRGLNKKNGYSPEGSILCQGIHVVAAVMYTLVALRLHKADATACRRHARFSWAAHACVMLQNCQP